MAYATITDVDIYAGGLAPDTESAPTAADSQTIIAGVESEMNVKLAVAGLTVPFVPTVDPNSVAFSVWLRTVSCWGSAATIIRAISPSAEGPDGALLWSYYEKKYQTALKAIEDGSALPTSLGGVPASGDPASYYTRFPDDDSDEGDQFRPEFTRQSLRPGSTAY
jgi:hypothetical protein